MSLSVCVCACLAAEEGAVPFSHRRSRVTKIYKKNIQKKTKTKTILRRLRVPSTPRNSPGCSSEHITSRYKIGGTIREHACSIMALLLSLLRVELAGEHKR